MNGDSAAPETVADVRGRISEGEQVLLLLDSAHSREHVLRELEAYHHLVQPGGYAIVQDGHAMQLVASGHGPRSETDWRWDNPLAAVHEFVRTHHGWRVSPPPKLFDESAGLGEGVTHWTGGWLRRIV